MKENRMYRITYEQGNGMHCGCCRDTWIETEDCKTMGDVEAWLLSLAADKRKPAYARGENDREVESIEKEIGVDIKDQFVTAEKDVAAEVQQRETEYRAKQKTQADKAKQKRVEEAEAHDRREYERLKKKYEGESE
jgi:hypothetical protein